MIPKLNKVLSVQTLSLLKPGMHTYHQISLVKALDAMCETAIKDVLFSQSLQSEHRYLGNFSTDLLSMPSALFHFVNIILKVYLGGKADLNG